MTHFESKELPTINELISSPTSGRVFHYTDNSGIMGIINSKTIWATEARYLNDTKEIELAKDYVKLHASNLRNNIWSNQFSSDEKELLEELEHHATVTRPGVCVASFSEERDQLSQWRAYSGEGGCCLGLSSSLLKDCAERQGFIFGRCTYSHEQCCAVANEILWRLLKRYRNSDKSEDAKKELKVKIGIDLAHYGPLLKHRSFSEEKEWRIITPQIGIGDKRLDFRSSDGKILPFVAVDIEACLRKRGQKDGCLVILGPGNRGALGSFAIDALIYREIGNGVALGVSDTPFRT